MDPLTRYPCRRADLAYRMVGGEAVVVAPAVSQVHELNPTASFIWEHCTGNIRGSEVLEALLNTFEVDPKVAHKDLRDTLLQFHELRLIDLNLRPQASEGQGRSPVNPQSQVPQSQQSLRNLGSHRNSAVQSPLVQGSLDQNPQGQSPQGQSLQGQGPKSQDPKSQQNPRGLGQNSAVQSPLGQGSLAQNPQGQSPPGHSPQSHSPRSFQSQNAQKAGQHPAERSAATTEGVES